LALAPGLTNSNSKPSQMPVRYTKALISSSVIMKNIEIVKKICEECIQEGEALMKTKWVDDKFEFKNIES
jgi:hypothetical protein